MLIAGLYHVESCAIGCDYQAHIYRQRSGEMLLQASTLVPNNFSTSFMLMKRAIRRLKEKFAEEQKIVRQRMAGLQSR